MDLDPCQESERNLLLKQLLVQRNAELESQYARVASLVEQLSTGENELDEKDKEVTRLKKKVTAQVAYINELQISTDKMHSENKNLQRKLEASGVPPDETQESLQMLLEQKVDWDMEKKALRQQLREEARTANERGIAMQEQKEEYSRLIRKLEHALEETQKILGQEKFVSRNFINLVYQISAEVKALHDVMKTHQRGEKPDVAALVGRQKYDTFPEDSEVGEDARAQMHTLLQAVKEDMQALRQYTADNYALSIAGDCAVQ